MQIFAEFESHEALVREFENNLGKARAFLSGSYDVAERDQVELVIIHPVSGEWLPLKAEVVYIAPPEQPAVGLEILDWDPERAQLLQSFVDLPKDNPLSLVSPASLQRERFELTQATPHVTIATASQPPSHAAAAEPSLEPLQLSHPAPPPEQSPPLVQVQGSPVPPVSAAVSPPDDQLVHDDGDEPREETEAERPPLSSRRSSSVPPSMRSQPPPKNVQEKVRQLNLRERESMARSGTLTERVALERAYGAAVWDGLLANPALTGPEVARIAKNGNVTQPHLKIIVGNAAWLAKGEVRRALLTNPRLTPPQIERVLRALSPVELKKLPKQTAYAPKVRAAAMRMLSR